MLPICGCIEQAQFQVHKRFCYAVVQINSTHALQKLKIQTQFMLVGQQRIHSPLQLCWYILLTSSITVRVTVCVCVCVCSLVPRPSLTYTQTNFMHDYYSKSGKVWLIWWCNWWWLWFELPGYMPLTAYALIAQSAFSRFAYGYLTGVHGRYQRLHIAPSFACLYTPVHSSLQSIPQFLTSWSLEVLGCPPGWIRLASSSDREHLSENGEQFWLWKESVGNEQC